MKKILLPIVTVSLGIASLVYWNSTEKETSAELEQYAHQQELYANYQASGLSSIKELPKKDRPDLAYLQDFERTKDPALGYPPEERRFEVYKIVKERLREKAKQKAIDNVEWTERGPNNVGGRTRALMFDPNDPDAKKVFAGSVSGGLWYNNDITDENSIWHPIDDFMANLSISSIVYDPDNTSHFFAGTGEGFGTGIRGGGIWESIDQGVTWTQLASTNNGDFSFVQKLMFTSDGTLIAAANGGVFRSINNGDSWTSVIDGRGADLEQTTDDVLFASTGLVNDEGFIYKSINDGVDWTDITPADNGNRIELATSPSNANVVYAVSDGGGKGTDEIGYFVKSSDQGNTWQDITVPSYTETDCETIGERDFTRGQAWYDLILAVLPNDENDVIVGGIDLNKTLNSGETWGLISSWTGACDDLVHADQHAIVFRPGHPTEALFGTDGGIYYSKNLEDINPHFESRNNGYNVTQFYSVAAANIANAHYYLAGAQDNGTQQLNQPGVDGSFEVTGGDGAFCFIDQNDSDIQITSYVYNSYYLSQDGGKTFVSISDDEESGDFINPSDYDSDSKTLYSAGNNNELKRIENIDGTIGSLTMETANVTIGGSISHVKVSPYSSDVVYVGSGNKVTRLANTSTGAPTSTDITGSLSGQAGTISSIDIGETESHLLVTFSNYGVTSVFETTDGGTTWENKEGDLPDMPVRWGLFNPNNRSQVLLATELGVWSTDDITVASPEWEPTNSGLANVRCDMIKYRESDGQVIVASYGRGVYTSNIFASTPVSSFKIDRLVAYEGVGVNFTDASILPNDSWSWTFGDGGTSTDQNPVHTFTTAGTYDVSLSIDGAASSMSKSITVLPSKSTPYGLSDGGNFEVNPTDFAGVSLLNGENLWELGTPSGRLATVSSGTKAWKTDLDADIDDKGFDYKFALYTPSFDFSDTDADYSIKFLKSLENSFCNAPMGMQMQYSKDGGVTWNTLGKSEEEYGSINWYNRGGNTGCDLASNMFENQVGWNYSNVNSTDNSVDNENTQHKLNFLIGEPNVSFRFVVGVVTGYSTYDRDGFMIDDFEIVKSEPTAEFSVSSTVSPVGGILSFTYQSAGALTYAWDFGDGNTSDVQNPTHSYASSGIYTVSLTITNNSGTVVEEKTDLITILPKYEPEYLGEDGGNFETNQSDFVAENIVGTPFELGESTVNGKDGTASGSSAWVTGLSENNYQNDSEARLYTPVFDLSGSFEYKMLFKAKYSFEPDWDGFIVQYSTDLGDTWKKLNDVIEDGWYDTESHPDAVFGERVPIFSGTTGGEFEEFSTDLTFLLGEENVMIRFLFLSDAASVDAGLALDDFEITKNELIQASAEFVYSSELGCSGHTVIFTSTSTGSISAYAWDFGAGATPVVAEGIGPHEVTYNVEEETQSTVRLTVDGHLNGEITEVKEEVISTGPDHKPTITEGDVVEGTTELIASDGEIYQWYYENEIIEGATDKTYTATLNGEYYVNVSVSGCPRFSSNFEVELVTDVDDLSLASAFDIFPNPSDGTITLELNELLAAANDQLLKLYDLTGKVVFTQSVVKPKSNHNLSSLKKGTYILELSGAGHQETKRIILK